VVQAPTGTSAAVAWAVNDTSTGWIEYGETEELGQVAFGTNEGLQPLDAFVHKVRLPILQPGTKYFYRTVSVPIAFMGPYDIRRGRPFESATHHELAVTMRKLDGTTIGTYTYGRRAS